ncbi:hypothetical protein LMJ38_23760 [Streptomyces sp. R1]|uniref:hypothetical protein n=1 Tax=Streptomyces sp. R1 TaxID=1509279 RepID=UPI001E2EA5A8|nr:hypothetical protein [Streptomyces sp. R1]MCC8338939.1 hypothetical protein [Streptomyces sp. R1]
MTTDAVRRRTPALLALLVALWCLTLAGPVTAAHAAPGDTPSPHASYGPDSGRAPPSSWQASQVGVDTEGNYCQLFTADGCRPLAAGERTGSGEECPAATSQATTCLEGDREAAERTKLESWRDKTAPASAGDRKLDAFLASCIDHGETFQSCYAKGTEKFPQSADRSTRWVAGKVSESASDALQETAGYIGNAVVWLLEEFSEVFGISSAIDLNSPGVSNVAGVAGALSAVVATFLLLVQFGRVSLSRQGGPAAAAAVGLAKWAVISSVYFVVIQTALTWSDAVSTWIVNYTFPGDGSGRKDAADAMREQLGQMFSGLTTGAPNGQGSLTKGDAVNPPAVGVVIVVGIVCILVIGALWVQLLMRQAAVLVLVATMPVVLAGQVSDATRTWWPRARDALVVLILLKPTILVVFSIGLFAMRPSSGVQNMIVGLVVFLMACAVWPVLARTLTPRRWDAAAQLTSGLLGAFGAGGGFAHQPQATGAGTVGGGSAYTRALERESAPSASDPAAQSAGKRTFWSNDLRETGFESRPRADSPSAPSADTDDTDSADGTAGTDDVNRQPVLLSAPRPSAAIEPSPSNEEE